MRTILLMAFLLFSPSNVITNDTADDVVVMQINAKWNKHHNIDLDGLVGCQVQFAWLEDQPSSIKENVSRVPIIVVYKKSKPVMQWTADLSFSLNVPLKEIQKVVDKL